MRHDETWYTKTIKNMHTSACILLAGEGKNCYLIAHPSKFLWQAWISLAIATTPSDSGASKTHTPPVMMSRYVTTRGPGTIVGQQWSISNDASIQCLAFKTIYIHIHIYIYIHSISQLHIWLVSALLMTVSPLSSLAQAGTGYVLNATAACRTGNCWRRSITIKKQL